MNDATPSRDALPAIAVGGGLAGTAFAIALARSGRRVLVLERSRGPHHTVCGEFLSEEAQVVLGSLGIDPQVLGATTITHFRLAKGERQAVTRLPFAAAGLSRFRIDEALLGAAARRGVEVVRGRSVTGIELGDGTVAVPRPPHGISPASCSSSSSVAAMWGPVWSKTASSLAWVMQDHLVRTVGSDWPAQRAHLSRQSSLMGDVLAGARPLFARPVATAAIPYGFLRAKPLAPTVFPVGDQLAVVPSFTGDGMAIALYSGLQAARAVMAGQPAAAYQRELISRLRPQFRLAGGIARLLETPATCGIAVAAAKLLPPLVAGIIAATRLRGFGDIAASLGVQRSMAMK